MRELEWVSFQFTASHNACAAIGAGIIGSFVYGQIVPDVSGGVAPDPAAWYPVLYVVIGMYVLCSLTWLVPNTAKPLFDQGEHSEVDP